MPETERVERLAKVLDDHRRGESEHDCIEGVGWVWACWCECGWHGRDRDHEAHVAAALLAVVAEIEAEARAGAWDEAAELADSVIVSWQGVPGLHPEAQEPHPAAIAAAGARRTLVVLRSRVAEAFSDRAECIASTAEEDA